MTRRAFDLVAIILALAVAFSMLFIVVGVMANALKHGHSGNTLSPNETQILTAAFGGIFGVLGAYIGYHAAIHTEPQAPVPEGWPDPEKTAEFPAIKEKP